MFWILVSLMMFVQPDDTAQRVHGLTSKLIAPCCWQESVANHQSPAALEARAEVERLVREGKTDQEILDLFVAKHGERILLEPRGLKQTWLLVLPVAFVALGAFWVGRYLKRAVA